MNDSTSKYPIDDPSDIIKYFLYGYHAFIGCDDPSERDSIVESLQISLDGQIQERIFCEDVSTLTDFATKIVETCQSFVVALGAPSLQRMQGIASSLEEAMKVYGQSNRQGYLILSDMDNVLDMQRTFEIEGPLRSVMQLRDDIAVVILASNDTIDGMVGDYKRPFYCSFRVFRL